MTTEYFKVNSNLREKIENYLFNNSGDGGKVILLNPQGGKIGYFFHKRHTVSPDKGCISISGRNLNSINRELSRLIKLSEIN